MFYEKLEAIIKNSEIDLKDIQKNILEKGWYNAIYWNYTDSAFMVEYKIELLKYKNCQ
jgi:hypothetical protein